jgi:hypothetical protein
MGKPSSSKKSANEALVSDTETEGASASAASAEDGKNPAAVQLGRLGGIKGGPARARKLTKEQRSAIARKAALARWAKQRRS